MAIVGVSGSPLDWRIEGAADGVSVDAIRSGLQALGNGFADLGQPEQKRLMQGLIRRVVVDCPDLETDAEEWTSGHKIRTKRLLAHIELESREPSVWGSEGSLRACAANQNRVGSYVLDFGSPRTPKIRTSAPPLSVAFYVGGPTGMNGRIRRRALCHAFSSKQLPASSANPPHAPEPKADRAALFQAMLDSGQVRNRAELARTLGCSRAWVTKVLGSGDDRAPSG